MVQYRRSTPKFIYHTYSLEGAGIIHILYLNGNISQQNNVRDFVLDRRNQSHLTFTRYPLSVKPQLEKEIYPMTCYLC